MLHVELQIRLVAGGICTSYVHEHLKEGDETINGPYGDFCLRETDTPIIFIAGGSGMAPIKSILLDMRGNKIHVKQCISLGLAQARPPCWTMKA